ncbi:MAG: hypothetical protein AABW79_03255 [Nanoarchaeota archaeon]
MRSRTYHLDSKFGFLQPSLKQIVWTLILVVAFLPFVEYDSGIRCVTIPCPSSGVVSPLGYFFFHYTQVFYGISWTILILGTILTYVFVSLVTAVRHNKIR